MIPESRESVKKGTVILLIAHGSLLAEANQEVRSLADQVQEKLGHPVRACFLELSEPSIPEAIDHALKEGASQILALPYFLTQGRHLTEDIPKILQEKARAYPETPIRLLNYLGSHSNLPELLAQLIENQH